MDKSHDLGNLGTTNYLGIKKKRKQTIQQENDVSVSQGSLASPCKVQHARGTPDSRDICSQPFTSPGASGR